MWRGIFCHFPLTSVGFKHTFKYLKTQKVFFSNKQESLTVYT